MVFIDHHNGTRYTLIEHISNSPSGIFYIEDSMILGDYSVSGKLPPGKFPPIKLPPRKSTPAPPRKIPTPKILTQNIPTHVFKYSHPSFQKKIFIIVTVFIDTTSRLFCNSIF